MPKEEKDIELEKLKGDPNMWMRLTMLSEDGRTMKSVFTDKENPFIKNSAGAMDKIQSLADEGRLYLREEGRSRHFHAVNKDGDSLKLGEQREMKMANTASDPALAVLMWLSKHYFRWIGLDGLSKWLGFAGISNWFEKKLQDRRDAIEVDDRYSKEYKAMSAGKKKELNAIRKHEKIMKKLEKIQKEAELSEQTLNELRGQQAPSATQQAPTTTQQAPTTTQQEPTAPQQQAPLVQPPEIKTNENTMQPTLTGDKPVQNQIPVPPKLDVKQDQKQAVQQEITGEKKEAPQQKEKKSQLFIEGVELTEETAKQFPPHIVEAFKLIQQLVNEKEANEKGNQQPVQQPVVTVENENREVQKPENEEQVHQVQETQVQETQVQQPQLQENLPVAEEPVQTEGVLFNLDEFQQSDVHNADVPTFDFVDPVDPKPTLRDQLAEEKQAMDNVKNWRDTIANSLFSHEEAKSNMDYYQSIKDQPEIRSEYVLGAVFGVLMKSSEDPETHQQVIDALLSGKPLGSDKNDLIRDGVSAYNQAFAQKTNGSGELMADMVANTIKVLSQQASRETSLSPRHAMIGRLLASAARMADGYDLDVPLTQEDLDHARGAKTLSDVAKGYLEARQYLGNEPMDIASERGRKAVNKLLSGTFVEKMIQEDQAGGQTITGTQMLMGKSVWTAKNLEEMTGNSTSRRAVDQEQLQAILETPNSLRTLVTAKRIGDEVIAESMGLQKQVDKNTQKEIEMGQLQEQPEINLLQFPG